MVPSCCSFTEFVVSVFLSLRLAFFRCQSKSDDSLMFFYDLRALCSEGGRTCKN
jgi:hypothetical protein